MPDSGQDDNRHGWTFFAVFLAIYLQNTVVLPGIGVFPGPLGFLACIALFPFVAKRVRQSVLSWIALAASAALTLGLFSHSAESHLARIPLGAVQLGTLFLLGYLFFLHNERFDPRTFHRLCCVAFGILLIVCSAEIYSPNARGIMDEFRLFFYGGTRTYLADTRDILEHGGIRPKALASEPSYLAQYGSLLFIGAMLTSRGIAKRLLLLGTFGLFVLLVRSPSLISGILAAPLYYALASVKRSFRRVGDVRQLELGLFWFATMYVVAVGLLVITLSDVGQQDGRLAAILAGRDSSYLQRLGVPLAITVQVIGQWPLFGVGIGGNESINQLILEAYASMLPNFYYFFDAVGGSIGSNAIIHWTYFGLAGGVLMIWIYNRLVLALSGQQWAGWVWAFYLPFCFTVGGYSYHAWPPLFFVAAALMQVDRMVVTNTAKIDPVSSPRQFARGRTFANRNGSVSMGLGKHQPLRKPTT